MFRESSGEAGLKFRFIRSKRRAAGHEEETRQPVELRRGFGADVLDDPLVKHFTANGIDLAKLAGRVLNEDLDPLALVDQRRGPDECGFDGIDAEVELPGALAIAQHAPVAVAADHCELNGVGVCRQKTSTPLAVRDASNPAHSTHLLREASTRPRRSRVWQMLKALEEGGRRLHPEGRLRENNRPENTHLRPPLLWAARPPGATTCGAASGARDRSGQAIARAIDFASPGYRG